MKKVQSILIAIMFQEPLDANFSYFSLTGKFQQEFKQYFENVEPVPLLPGAQGAPPEIPRYLLKSEESPLSEFTFSGIRFDFRFIKIADFKKESIVDHLNSIKTVLSDFNIKPFRIGIVTSGLIKLDKDEFFLKEYLKMQDFEDYEEIQASYRKTITLKGYTLNEWIKYGAYVENNFTNFELDINTKEAFNLDRIVGFGEVYSNRIGDFIEY